MPLSKLHTPFLFVLLLLFGACSSSPEPGSKESRKANLKGEYIYRIQDEKFFAVDPPERTFPDPYPWEKGTVGNNPKVTKEFFRCKGSSLNPVHLTQVNGESVRYYDCGGAEKHSLPLRDNKEFIYTILIDLINHIQEKTKKRVVITCGHRCPEHNAYADPSPENQHSKHMIGAEVSFYVQGLEYKPETIIKYIQEFYKSNPKYKGQKDFEEFQRYDKGDTNVVTQPWYNKEIFIKLHNKKEGRDFDNRHPYPYISIQVRYDIDRQEKVIYTWDKATHNYLRW